MADHGADVAAVLAEALFDKFRLNEWGADNVAKESLAALTAAGYAVVKLPEGVAVEHGARLVCWSQRPMAQQLYAIEPPKDSQ